MPGGARTQELGTAAGLVAAVSTVRKAIAHRVRQQADELVAGELGVSTAPWGGATGFRAARRLHPFLGGGVSGGEGSGRLGGSQRRGGKTLTVPGGHSLVPGVETKSLHAAVRDECHPEAAGVGVECGGRRPPTHSARGQVGGDGGSELRASRSGGCPGPAVLLPQALTWGGWGQKGSFHFPGSSDFPDRHVCPSVRPTNHPSLWAFLLGQQRWELHLTERGGDLPKVTQQAGGRAGPLRSGFSVSSQSSLSHCRSPVLSSRQWCRAEVRSPGGRGTHLRRGPSGSGEISKRSKRQEATLSMLSASILSCIAWSAATWMCHTQWALGG